jgi:hypothetical protein
MLLKVEIVVSVILMGGDMWKICKICNRLGHTHWHPPSGGKERTYTIKNVEDMINYDDIENGRI